MFANNPLAKYLVSVLPQMKKTQSEQPAVEKKYPGPYNGADVCAKCYKTVKTCTDLGCVSELQGIVNAWPTQNDDADSVVVKSNQVPPMPSEDEVLAAAGQHPDMPTEFIVVADPDMPGYCVAEVKKGTDEVVRHIRVPNSENKPRYEIEDACAIERARAGLRWVRGLA